MSRAFWAIRVVLCLRVSVPYRSPDFSWARFHFFNHAPIFERVFSCLSVLSVCLPFLFVSSFYPLPVTFTFLYIVIIISILFLPLSLCFFNVFTFESWNLVTCLTFHFNSMSFTLLLFVCRPLLSRSLVLCSSLPILLSFSSLLSVSTRALRSAMESGMIALQVFFELILVIRCQICTAEKKYGKCCPIPSFKIMLVIFKALAVNSRVKFDMWVV